MGFEEDLAKELEKTGTAEIIDGQVYPVLQKLDETDTHTKFLLFGVLTEEDIIPIDQACSICSHHLKFESIKKCQNFQAEGARARNFNKLICPHQFKSEYENMIRRNNEREDSGGR